MDGFNQLSSITANAQTLSRPNYDSVDAFAHQGTHLGAPSVIVPENTTSNTLEYGAIGKKIAMPDHKSVKWASFLLALFGLVIIAAALLIKSGQTSTILLEYSGVTIFFIAILLYFITPSKLVRSEIFDASSISNTEMVNSLLTPILGEKRGLYVPSSLVGITQVFLQAKNTEICKAFNGSDLLNVSNSGRNGVFITPPGYGLYTLARNLGASFTDEGLADEIEDIIVNGMELAPHVDIKRSDDKVLVRVHGLAESPICKTMRQRGVKACVQAGCPVCSFIACMIVEGTGKCAMIHDTKVTGNAMDLTYTLY